ncbi:MAG: recombination mediator RecR [Pseudomonadales bacterium]|nr:recombination mediator RecR [Pseudomonadales bacterium]
MFFSPLIDQLVQAFRCLPGVGPKSAQRMALHLLEHNRSGGLQLVEALQQALDNVSRCRQCRTLSENELCSICNNPNRNKQLLCVVESPADVFAIEQTGSYRGQYFVLMGHLSPIDGIGPEDIGIPELLLLLKNGDIGEVILACNSTVEGEATAWFIAEQVRHENLLVSRIAHGVPVGGELEFIDGGTLSHAFNGRQVMR